MFKNPHKIIIILIFLSLPTIALVHQITTIANPDLGLHLKIGEIILSQKYIPLTNLFSYTYPTFQYINLAWLSQVIFFLIYAFWGFNGLIYLHILAILITLFIPIIFCLKKKSLSAIGFVIFLASIILLGRPDIRPEMFSYLFLSATVTILFLYKERFTKWILLLIPMQLLWVNMHIYFILGLIIIWVFLIEQIITKNLQSRKQIKLLIIVAIISTLVSLFNPYGITGFLHPLLVFNNYGFSVDENNNIFHNRYPFHRINILFYWIYISCLLLVQFFNRKQTSFFEWFLSIFFSAAGIFVQRLVPLIIFATFIPFVKSLTFVINNLISYFVNGIKQRQKIHDAAIILLLCMFLFVANQIIHLQGFGLGVKDQGLRATNFFLNNNLHGPILNNYDIGNYLDFRLYPKEKVFIDGRPEAYPADFFQSTYIPLMQTSYNFKNIDNQYHFNTILITYQDKSEQTISFIQQTLNNSDWKLIYLDDFAIIFVKNNDNNKDIINRFAIEKNHVNISNFDSIDENGLTNIGILFMGLGWTDDEISIAKKILKKNPLSCPALGRLITIDLQKNTPFSQTYIDNYNSHCR